MVNAIVCFENETDNKNNFVSVRESIFTTIRNWLVRENQLQYNRYVTCMSITKLPKGILT